MASVSFLARTVARRSFVASLSSTSKLGAVRFSSYFTPGKKPTSNQILLIGIIIVFGAAPLLFMFSLINSSSFSAHEYVTVDGEVGTCGITDFAQAALGDIVFIDLPEVGDEFSKGDSFGSVESVKAASDVYAPVSGTVVEVNEVLSDEPGLVNSEAEGSAWFIKLKLDDEGELGDLMGADEYKAHCEKESH
jgi:glycine cleavage system H protein